MENKIKKITITLGAGVRVIEVGIDNVAEIIDKSAAFETSIHFIYWVYDNTGEVVTVIENAPTVIDY